MLKNSKAKEAKKYFSEIEKLYEDYNKYLDETK
jgi:hypothetical protein